MSQLIPLHFENADVRTVIVNGEPWWVGIDVTAMLDLRDGHQRSRASMTMRGVGIIYPPFGIQEMIIVNESGMYSLLLTSRKPIAKKFKRWLTCEVLPRSASTGVTRHRQKSNCQPPTY
jgi:prophage antirepressor-like protein